MASRVEVVFLATAVEASLLTALLARAQETLGTDDACSTVISALELAVDAEEVH